MIKADDKKLTPKEAAKVIIEYKLFSVVFHEDIPTHFKEATDREIDLIGEQYLKIVKRITKRYL